MTETGPGTGVGTGDRSGTDERSGPPTIAYNPLLKGEPFSHILAIDALRERHRSFRSDLAQGFWVITRADTIRHALQDPATFSSSSIIPIDPDPAFMLVPEMLDPPAHTAWRQLLASWFSPNAVARMEDGVRTRCIELIEPLVGRGSCELNQDFAYRYPTSIFLELMGLPLEDLPRFQHWNDEIHHVPLDEDPTRARSLAGQDAVKDYFRTLMDERRSSPRDDLVTAALDWRIGGEEIPLDDLLSMYLLMFQAGMDTVSSQLAYIWWHLARHDPDRRRIVEEPEIIPLALEEFLRFYAFVAPSRKLMRDVELEGCPMRKGDMVFVPLCGATRDPAAFPDAERFVIDRPANNHIAFGAGPHRCIGSHLARRELRIALEEWHRRIPDYRLVEGQHIDEHGGMFGLDSLELTWS